MNKLRKQQLPIPSSSSPSRSRSPSPSRTSSRKERGLPIAGATPLSQSLASAVDLNIHPGRLTYRAGERIEGVLGLTINSNDIWVAELVLELTGYEG
jgi:hypothetical protein